MSEPTKTTEENKVFSSVDSSIPNLNSSEKESEVTKESSKNKLLITGCSTGIGKACALHFNKLGWEVIATVRKAKDGYDLEEKGIIVKLCDIDDAEQVDALFQDPDVEGLTHAYLNAGYGYVTAIEDADRPTLEKQFQTNVFGTWQCFNHVIKIFRKQGFGRVIVCSSVIGFAPIAYRGPYGASKAALESMVATARVEIDDPNIQISCLNPGPVSTMFRPTCIKVYQESTKKVKDTSHHASAYEHQESRLAAPSTSKFAASPEDCARKIEKIFAKRRQAQNYPMTVPSHTLYYLKRFVPAIIFEKICRWGYKLEK